MATTNSNIKLGIIGGGVMAEAIASCLLEQKIYLAPEILVSEPQEDRRNYWQQKYGVQVTANNSEVF